MICPQIGKYCCIKHDSFHSVQFQCLGRHFHHHIFAAAIRHFPQNLIQFIRFRCCILALLLPGTITYFNGSDQSCLITGGNQHFPDHPDCGSLSFCPGNPKDAQLFLRVIKPLPGNSCKCNSGIRSFQYADLLHIRNLPQIFIQTADTFFPPNCFSLPTFHCV